MSGKGSKPRPFSVSQKHYASEFDRIFKKPSVIDELKGDGDTFEEKVSLSDEMQLHGEKHKPCVKEK